jgi:homoserine O-acetyltransferase
MSTPLITEKKILKLNLPDGGLRLEKGGYLQEIEVAYETLGHFSGNNAIYICHALTGDSHVAGVYNLEDKKPGWWDYYVGSGKAINTDRFFVVCSNILGGCSGTTGPSSINPATGREYGIEFPEITLGDVTTVQKMLLVQLGIEHLYAIVGGSLGAMNVLQWTVSFPDFADKALSIAGTASLSAMNLSFDIVGRNMIMRDPGWNSGNYYQSEAKPFSGLALARMIAHITYLSKESMQNKFGRAEKPLADGTEKSIFNTQFQIESYLDHQGEAFVTRFDANSYLYITKAMDEFDITRGFTPGHRVFEPSRADFMIVALSSDWLFPPEESKEIAQVLLRADKNVTYCEIESEFGHDAFLIHNENLFNLLSTFLGDPQELGRKEIQRELSLNQEERQVEQIIEAMLPLKADIVDLGCGRGGLLSRHRLRTGMRGQGIDIDFQNVLALNRLELPLFQTDLDKGLSMIPDHFYDAAILSSTLQTVKNPALVVREMLRVARIGLISFPNISNWRNRLSMLLTGKLPQEDSLSSNWTDDESIHLLSMDDFTKFCNREGISITEEKPLGKGFISQVFLFLGLVNLGADKVVVKIELKAN